MISDRGFKTRVCTQLKSKTCLGFYVGIPLYIDIMYSMKGQQSNQSTQPISRSANQSVQPTNQPISHSYQEVKTPSLPTLLP